MSPVAACCQVRSRSAGWAQSRASLALAFAAGLAVVAAAPAAAQRPGPAGGISASPEVVATPDTPSKSNAEQQKKDAMPAPPEAAADDKHVYPKALKSTVDELLRKRDVKKAIEALDEAIAKSPGNARLLIARSDIRCWDRKPQPCLEDADKAVAADAAFAEAFLHRAWVRMYHMSRPGEAFADLETAIRLEPERPGGYYLRGLAQRQLRNHPQALADLDRALAKDPKHAHALQAKSVTLYLMEKHDEALATASAAIALNDRLNQAWAIRGLVRLAKGDQKAARSELQKALSINSRDYYAQLGMQALNVGTALDIYAARK